MTPGWITPLPHPNFILQSFPTQDYELSEGWAHLLFIFVSPEAPRVTA